MDPFDPKVLRWEKSTNGSATLVTQRRLPRHLKGEKFLKGPIPFHWLQPAAHLGWKPLVVALVLWHQHQVQRGEVRPSHKILDSFGVNRWAANRAYTKLEAAGLISVVREIGKNPTITILGPPLGVPEK